MMSDYKKEIYRLNHELHKLKEKENLCDIHLEMFGSNKEEFEKWLLENEETVEECEPPSQTLLEEVLSQASFDGFKDLPYSYDFNDKRAGVTARDIAAYLLKTGKYKEKKRIGLKDSRKKEIQNAMNDIVGEMYKEQIDKKNTILEKRLKKMNHQPLHWSLKELVKSPYKPLGIGGITSVEKQDEVSILNSFAFKIEIIADDIKAHLIKLEKISNQHNRNKRRAEKRGDSFPDKFTPKMYLDSIKDKIYSQLIAIGTSHTKASRLASLAISAFKKNILS